ncbi:unnamed protein product [Bemisia tabaci]|uniref:Chitin-binding type-2 domain-containing protein n=1 Tax=Bemisia tabaci TaxID=7038 RepID=A0A9P0CGB0_BEMTA|nr:unnamed protein product [Bemisia tabaci]
MRWHLALFLLFGFSLGDELGFRESLSNLEATRRRSVDTGRSANLLALFDNSKKEGKDDAAVSSRSFSPRVQGSKQGFRSAVAATGVATVPPFKPIAGAGGPGNLSRPARLSGAGATGPGTAPAAAAAAAVPVPSFHKLPPSIAQMPTIPAAAVAAVPALAIPAVQSANRRYAIVGSGSPVSNDLATPVSGVGVGVVSPSLNLVKLGAIDPQTLIMGHTIQSLAKASNISVDSLIMAIRARQQQQQLLQQQIQMTSVTPAPTTTTTTTTQMTTTMAAKTAAPIRAKYALSGAHKVMNAPKEYYPVSYDKNFDDNFTARVELPETSFSCGDQKHFPGLYADEDLGCMVFHVCAFTDDGLVMKSFLCPESTLFDQTILKCNWWFYVDCKASKKLYDSNIPVSKSYQLMKALAFFSSYNNSNNKEQSLPS